MTITRDGDLQVARLRMRYATDARRYLEEIDELERSGKLRRIGGILCDDGEDIGVDVARLRCSSLICGRDMS